MKCPATSAFVYAASCLMAACIIGCLPLPSNYLAPTGLGRQDRVGYMSGPSDRLILKPHDGLEISISAYRPNRQHTTIRLGMSFDRPATFHFATNIIGMTSLDHGRHFFKGLPFDFLEVPIVDKKRVVMLKAYTDSAIETEAFQSAEASISLQRDILFDSAPNSFLVQLPRIIIGNKDIEIPAVRFDLRTTMQPILFGQ